MKKTFLSIIFTLVWVLAAQAQSYGSSRQGTTTFEGDAQKAEQLVRKHIEFNERTRTIPGYRIQIAALSGSNSKSQAFALRDRFMATFEDCDAYVIFDEPNFRVKIGNFRTRLEAYAYLQRIKDLYPGTIVKDNIYPIPFEEEAPLEETDDGI